MNGSRWLPLLFALLISAVIVSAALGRENFYDVRGEYSYLEVLQALAGKSGRSVVGSDERLKTVRSWHIDNEPFSVAVDAVCRNLETEGYTLQVTPDWLFVHRPDSVATKRVYEVYQPYRDKWVVTESREVWLNALPEDRRERLRDSLANVDEGVWRVDLLVEGWSCSAGRAGGVVVDGEISTRVGVPVQMPAVSLAVGIIGNRDSERMDFRRRYLLYLGDSSSTVRFGSEVRRVQSTMTADRVLQTAYESVYDGLTLRWKGPERYGLEYRVGDATIELAGVPDSVTSGSALVRTDGHYRQWGVFRSKRRSERELVVIARAKIERVAPR